MKRKRLLSIVASLGMLMPSLIASSSAAAQSFNQITAVGNTAARIGFVPPSNERAPRQTHSGASRRLLPAQCGGLALLPESGSGLTSSEQLSLYVYLAKGTVVDEAILSLMTSDESEYYEANLTLPKEEFSESGGVMEVAFPELPPRLTADEDYTWSLVLKCNGQIRPDSPVLGGGIKRVNPTWAEQPDMSLTQQAEAYGTAGLWYDLLDTLVLMRAEEPASSEALEHWSSVLETVGLDLIADAPLVTQ